MAVLLFAPTVVQVRVFGSNRADGNMKASALGLLVTIILDFMLIPKYAAVGGPLASSASYLVTTAYVTISFARIGSLPLKATILPVPDDFRYLASGLKSFLR